MKGINFKKLGFASLSVILAFLVVVFFAGCPDPDSTEPGGNGSGSGSGSSGTTVTAGSTLQEQIDNTGEGGTAVLNPELVSTGTSIVISRAITVNGNNISGLSVTVDPSVTAGVTLRNFRNANITVASSSSSGPSSSKLSSRSTLNRRDSAPVEDEDLSFKKFGDDSLPLYLEGCTVEKFEAADDVALHLGKGEEKTVIDELCLKEGVEDFTFIEFDDADTVTSEKSKVEKLSIEDDGVQKINLIGGTFDDVAFADDFAGEIEFKYDKEFEDQFGDFDGKNDFFADDKVEAKDIAVADDLPEQGSTGDNVYKFTMSRELFDILNGHISIIFLTEEQAANACDFSSAHMELLNFETPAYDMSLMGPFTVESNEGSIADGTYAVYGASKLFFDYANSTPMEDGWGYRFIRKVTLEKYMTYSKEAVVIEVGASEVNVYVNKTSVRKSDLLLCSGYAWQGQGDEASGSSEGGTKLSNISLEAYTPFFCVNQYDFSEAESVKNELKASGEILYGESSGDYDFPVYIPSSDKNAFPGFYYPFAMTKTDSYPDVSSVTYPDVEIPSERVTVRYYNSSLVFTSEDTNKIRNNIDPFNDDWEYYLDENFSNMIYGTDGFEGNVNWDAIYEDNHISSDTDLIIYARPKRNIRFVWPDWDVEFFGPVPISSLANIEFGDTIQYGIDTIKLFQSYDSSNGTYSQPITRVNDSYLTDGCTVYITYPMVKVYAVGIESGTEPVFLRTVKAQVLKDRFMGGVDFHLYKSATVSDTNEHDAESVMALDLNASVYVTTPLIWVDPELTPTETEGQSVLTPAEEFAFADFYALIQQADHPTYYYEVRDPVTTFMSYPECTKDSLDEWVASENFDIGMQLSVYTTNPEENNGSGD